MPLKKATQPPERPCCRCKEIFQPARPRQRKCDDCVREDLERFEGGRAQPDPYDEGHEAFEAVENLWEDALETLDDMERYL
jgi:hypothetical protein